MLSIGKGVEVKYWNFPQIIDHKDRSRFSDEYTIGIRVTKHIHLETKIGLDALS